MAEKSSPAVEYKKDGTVSRMRAHKGNVPQLPQTKLCPFCPAKFTRTTHLNRHLRNHTNERLYRCEACAAQFTRSDLLARHRKSCSDSFNSNIGRARRRSCQPCAALKVKCDLRQPCSKCKARSRECTYPPENPDDLPPPNQAGSPAPVAGPSRRVPPVGVANLDGSAGFDPGSLTRPDNAYTSAFPELSLIEETSSAFAPPLSEANLDAFLGMQSQGGGGRTGAMSLPTVNDVASTANTAPSFNQFDNRAFTSFVPSDIAAPTNPAGLGSFSNDLFEPFFRGVFRNNQGESSNSPQPSANVDAAPPFVAAPDPSQMTIDQQTFENMFNPNPSNGLTITGDGQNFMSDFDQELLMDMISTTYPSIMQEPDSATVKAHQEVMNIFPGQQNATYTQEELNAMLQPLPAPVAEQAAPPKKVPNPTTEELQQYLHIFLTAFSPQIPIIHTPTLRVEYKPAMLVRAMQACGALFVKTEVAEAFVEETLATSREALVAEFAKPVVNPKHQLLIIMTLILLQTIGLFHQDPQQRAASNIYHGMLVLMVRQNRVMERSLSWTMPSFPSPDPDALDAAWRDWAVHEAIKRTILLVYCHDHSHRIFFGLPTSFTPEEMVLALPCEEALWTAKSPFAWSQLLLAESAYGSIQRRILGVPMLHGMAALGLEGGAMDSAEPLKDVGIISPFGHFVLMHALIGELVRRCSSAESPVVKAKKREEEGQPPEQEEEVNEHVFAMQLALHKWLKLWLQNPESPRPPPPAPATEEQKTPQDPGYAADPLPFYWLGQLLLLAFQEGLPPFAPPPPPPPPSSDEHSPEEGSSSSSSGNGYSPFAPSPFVTSPYASSPKSSVSPPSSHESPPANGNGNGKGKSPATHPSPPDTPTGMHYTKYTKPMEMKKPPQTDTSTAQFSLIKNWLQHIRLFLRKSEGSPTLVWDELMRIRLTSWYVDAGTKACKRALGELEGEDAEEHGLLGFFEEKLKI